MEPPLPSPPPPPPQQQQQQQQQQEPKHLPNQEPSLEEEVAQLRLQVARLEAALATQQQQQQQPPSSAEDDKIKETKKE
ncbi:hypothetical protein ACHAPT_005097 [Fusarium lateritium]